MPKKKKKTTSHKKGSQRKTAAGKKANGTPQRRSCGCMQSFFGLLDKYPQFRFNQTSIEGFTNACMRAGRSSLRTGVITIPVVVHVVHNTTAEDISDAQIKSQIAVLNKDFTKTNSDVTKVPPAFKNLVGNPQIKFELAKQNPNGNSTDGIVRQPTNETTFGIDDGVKSSQTGGSDAWDTSKFLNIWVCTLSGGLLGYAQFPGGPPETDGVVILNTAFGTSGTASAPFNKGRTTTHEIGHYLNLSHIWGESRIANCQDSDFVDDTPNQFGPNFSTPTFPTVSCNNSPNGDMFMNYMDYVDDAAMFMFTEGQVNRMRATLTGPRSDLGT